MKRTRKLDRPLDRAYDRYSVRQWCKHIGISYERACRAIRTGHHDVLHLPPLGQVHVYSNGRYEILIQRPDRLLQSVPTLPEHPRSADVLQCVYTIHQLTGNLLDYFREHPPLTAAHGRPPFSPDPIEAPLGARAKPPPLAVLAGGQPWP